MFNYERNFDEENLYGTISHLQDYGESELGIDLSGMTMGLSEDMEAEQLQSIKAEIEAAIKAEIERLRKIEEAKWPACHIGPYAGGRCTICGGRQPS